MGREGGREREKGRFIHRTRSDQTRGGTRKTRRNLRRDAMRNLESDSMEMKVSAAQRGESGVNRGEAFLEKNCFIKRRHAIKGSWGKTGLLLGTKKAIITGSNGPGENRAL